METVKRDLDDDDHDAQVKRGDLHEDTRILRHWQPCPMPGMCEWKGGVCMTCGKRDSISSQTQQLQMLAMARKGGMPVGRDELPFAAWIALGMLESRSSSEMLGALAVGRM